MTTSQIIIIFTIVYCVAMVILSYVVGKATTKDETEFMVGGREFNWFLTAVGNGSILISGGYLPSIIMYGYMYGMGGMWYYIGWGSGALIALLTWAGFWRTSGALTPTEWFEYRYGKGGRIAITFVILLAAVASLAWQYLGCGDTMGAVLGISPKLAMVIVGAVVTLYVVFGGIWAATATDLFQFSWVFIIQFIILPIYLIAKYGMLDASALPAGFLSIPFGSIPIGKLVVPSVATFLMMHQSLLNQAQYWARAAGTRSLKDLKTGWTLTVIIAFFTGIVGAFTGCYVRLILGDTIQASAAFGSLMNVLPPILAACTMAGLMAATMSTCDIVLVSSVNQLVRDIAQYFLKIKDSKVLLNWAKWGTIIYSAITIVFALVWESGISMMFAFGNGISAPLFIYYLDSWLLRVGNRKGCIASVVVSMSIVVYWEFIGRHSATINTLWLVFPAAFVTLLVVSLLTKNDPVMPISKSGPDEFQIEILKAIRRGYRNTGAIIARMTDYSNENHKQAGDVHKALDSLEMSGYVCRKGRRLNAQLYFSLSAKGEQIADAYLSEQEKALVNNLQLDAQALRFMQWIATENATFSKLSGDHQIYMLELSAIAEQLAEMKLVKVYGLTRLRAKLTDKGRSVLAQAQKV